MDVGLPPELMQVYQAELAERAARLVSGARALINHRLDPDTITDLIRDAHTIKGSSRMMGLNELGNAGEVLERAWKAVADNEPIHGDLGRWIEQLASMLPIALQQEQSGDVAELRQSISRVGALLTGPPPTAPIPTGSADERATTSLGGLLDEVERSVMTGVSRVETSGLYWLINQAVEVSLDADALSDLSLVQFEGADPARLMMAWRAQLQRLSTSVQELQEAAVALANAPLRQATETFSQFVRYLGRKLGKDVRFESSGEDIVFDRQIVELMREPFRHLLVNATDHGLEPPEERVAMGKPPTGVVRLAARREGEKVIVVISDDGRGIDWKAVAEAARRRGLNGDESADLSSYLFLPGFTTVEEPHDFSGGGDGLSTVAEIVERVNGGFRLESSQGEGTSVTITLPVSLVLQNLMVVAVGDKFWGLPEAAVQASLPMVAADLYAGNSGERRVSFQSQGIPVVSLADALGVTMGAPEQEVVVLATRSGLVAVTVSEVLGRRRVAVKALGPILGGARHLTGAGLLGGGDVMVVVDPNYLGDLARQQEVSADAQWRVLVVDDSAGVRQLIFAALNGRGFDVEVAAGAREAVLALAARRFDALVVDYAMPRSNGVELVRALRAHGLKIPIVMVSGVAGPEDQSAAWDAGVDAYIDKFDLRQGALNSTLRHLMTSRRTPSG